jgi:hypothetical protein
MKVDLPHMDAYGQLWLAVLHKAVEDACAPLLPVRDNQGDNFYQRRARLWMVTERKGIGSLVWICSVFGIDPDDVRAEVRKRIQSRGKGNAYRTGVSARMVPGASQRSANVNEVLHGRQEAYMVETSKREDALSEMRTA